jgi:hypothetical protein
LHTKQAETSKTSFGFKISYTHIGLFGSIVRKDLTSKSDIDILVEFTRPIGVEFIDLANELESILSRKVDV